MPAVSKKQARFMGAVAGGSIKKPGLSKAQAKEYIKGQNMSKLPEKVQPKENPHGMHDIPETMEKGSEFMEVPAGVEPFRHLPKELDQRASDYKEALVQTEFLKHPQIKAK
jgi:hypothetical protein